MGGTSDASWARHAGHAAGPSMSDLVYILFTVGFFALAWGYVVACDRL